jgi:hypothetical protein
MTTDSFKPASYNCKKVSIGTKNAGGRLLVYFPESDSVQAMDEEAYQTTSEPTKAAVKKDTFGDFLSHWQGVISALRAENELPAFMITNCYDREENLHMFEKAMGYTSHCKIRIGHLGLGDRETADKWHANSSLLAPQELFGKDVSEMSKRGVIVEPCTIFPAQDLPTGVIAFLAKKPSAIVVLSSVSKQWTTEIGGALPCCDAYQVLFVNAACTTSTKEGHMYIPGPLVQLFHGSLKLH